MKNEDKKVIEKDLYYKLQTSLNEKCLVYELLAKNQEKTFKKII